MLESTAINRTLLALAAACLLCAAPLHASAQDASKPEETKVGDGEQTPKERDIRRFLALTGASQLADQTVRQMVSVYKKTMPEVPASFWKEFVAEFDADDLVARLVPIYDKHLSHDDIKALIEFYESPAGRRYTQALPKIAVESEEVGRRWGQEVAKRVEARLAAEGHSTTR